MPLRPTRLLMLWLLFSVACAQAASLNNTVVLPGNDRQGSFQRWVKRGIILKPGFAGARSTKIVSTPSVIKLKDGRLRIYFWGSGDDNGGIRSNHRYIFAAESATNNPFQWTLISPEPMLGPDPSDNIRDVGVSFQYVLPRNDGPWFMYYGAQGSWASVGKLATRTGLAISDDEGLSWKVLKETVLPLGEPGSHDAGITGGMSVLRTGPREYWMWYTAGERYQRFGEINRSIVHTGIARSSDGINWTKYPKPAISPLLDALTPFEAVTARPFVLEFDGVYHMWYSAFRMEGLGYRIEYARSSDGIHWERFADEPVMPLTPGGFDSKNQSYPAIIEMGDQLWMFYVGNDFGTTGIGLATMDKSALP